MEITTLGNDCAIHITLPGDSGDSIFPCGLLFSFVATPHTHQRSRDCVGTLRLRGSWQSEAFLLFIYLFPPGPLLSTLMLSSFRFQEGSCISVSAVDFSPHAHHNFQAGSPGGFFFFVFPAAGLSSPNLGPPDIGTSLLCGWLLGPGQTC